MAGPRTVAWSPRKQPVDFYILGGMRSPGLSWIEGLEQPRVINELRAPGNAGATCIYFGWKPAHFSGFTRLITDEDWLEWATFKTLLKLPARGMRGSALEFWHPFADMFDPPVRAVLVENILQPVTQEDGSEIIEVKYAQFNKPKIQYSKPEAAKDDPGDELDAAIKAAEQEAARLNKQAGDLEKTR